MLHETCFVYKVKPALSKKSAHISIQKQVLSTTLVYQLQNCRH